jgi:oligopeptidase A
MKPINFAKFAAKKFPQTLNNTLNHNRRLIKELLSKKSFSWDNFIYPLDVISDKLNLLWTTIYQLNALLGTKEIRAAYQKCLPRITKYASVLSQNAQIFQAINTITKSREYSSLDYVQKKIIKDKLRNFILAGVALPTKKKQIFTKLDQSLAKLSNKFSINVVDSSQAHVFCLTKKQTQGLPQHALAIGRNNALKKNKSGWLFTLDQPSYHAIVTFADSRSLRKKVYIAYATRASDVNRSQRKWDNSKIILEILKIKNQQAKLLGFKNYAEYSIAPKMVKNTEEVLNFLFDLAKRSKFQAKQELSELKQFAYKKDGIRNLKPWDLAYYEEKLSQKKFGLSQENLRPYFPENQVLTGISLIIKRLYGVSLKERSCQNVWHKDVRFFGLYDHKNKLIGKLYLDLYTRENKQGGAWMDDYQTRYRLKDKKIQMPGAFIVCNFAPPVNNLEALFTHEDVLTLLHEFGHALQHLLTKVDYIAASGIKGIPWDGVEFASQFMENWGWDKTTIQLMAKHYLTKKPLPKSLLNRLFKSHTFMAAIHMLRQLEFALIDFSIHLKSPSPQAKELKTIINRVQKQIRVTPRYKNERMLHAFSHIFAGPYSAGYYSYKWAEVLSADAFSKFTENGGFNRSVGREFLRYILETGGSEDPIVLFKKFRGRLPKIEPLLQQYGITK